MQFALRPIGMLETVLPALSRAAHLVLMRIEIESAHHGGADNGRLPVTYEDFEKYGVHPRMIAPAIREAEALGVIEVTERGCGGNAEFRRPSFYRLTYRHAKGETGDGTHEWKRVKTLKQARSITKAARAAADPTKVARSKKQNFALTKCGVSPSQSEGETTSFPPSQSEGTSPPSQSEGTLYNLGRDTEWGAAREARPSKGAVASEPPHGVDDGLRLIADFLPVVIVGGRA